MINQKICILLNWTREIDMYDKIISKLPEDKIEIIINDIKTFEKERKGNATEIEKILISKKKKFRYFSEVYNKEKYQVLISSGHACSLKISTYSILRYFYGLSIGRLLDITKLSKLLVKIFNRPFTADGKKSRIGLIWYPEKKIAKNVIKYPTGMDLKLKHYPYKEFEKNFDIFFTHGEFETSLIKKKFNDKICREIGYPRYENLNSNENILKELNKDFTLNNNKKIIFWTPTHIHYEKETHNNFLPWVDKISLLQKDFNIIIRPHPKALKISPSLEKDLINKGFLVDKKSDRKIGNLFKVSDLVFCDYGGTLFGAIYLEKPIILLNMKVNSEFIKDLKNNESLDIKMRKDLTNLDSDSNVEIMKLKISSSLNQDYKNKILDIKEKYFGNTKSYLSFKINDFLLDYLK